MRCGWLDRIRIPVRFGLSSGGHGRGRGGPRAGERRVARRGTSRIRPPSPRWRLRWAISRGSTRRRCGTTPPLSTPTPPGSTAPCRWATTSPGIPGCGAAATSAPWGSPPGPPGSATSKCAPRGPAASAARRSPSEADRVGRSPWVCAARASTRRGASARTSRRGAGMPGCCGAPRGPSASGRWPATSRRSGCSARLYRRSYAVGIGVRPLSLGRPVARHALRRPHRWRAGDMEGLEGRRPSRRRRSGGASPRVRALRLDGGESRRLFR